MKILLFSKIKLEVEVGGQKFFPTFSNPVHLEGGEFVKVFPLSANSLPFCFSCMETSKYVKTIQFPNYVLAEIVDLPKVFDGKFFLAKSIQGGSVNVVGSPYKLNINQKNTTFQFDLPEDLTEIELLDGKFAIFLRANRAEQNFVVAFHKKSCQFQSFCGSVEISETSVRAIVQKNTLAGHGQIVTYDLSGPNFALVQKEGVYLQKCPKFVPPFLAHIAFFEAVKEEDYILAKTYLDTALANKLSGPAIQEFFGQFDAIKVLSTNQSAQVALIKNITNHSAKGRVFEVRFENGKILDIREQD